MERRFILLCSDKITHDFSIKRAEGEKTFYESVLPLLREHGELYGPFFEHVDREFSTALGQLNKNRENYIFLDEELFGTDAHENVEFTRSFSPTLNHLFFFDALKRVIICDDDSAIPFNNDGLEKIFNKISGVCTAND